MQRIIFKAILAITIMVASLMAHAETNSPVGYWKTIDDVTGKPKAILHIQLSEQNKLFGRIIKIFPSPGKDQNEVCTACEGYRHNQRIVGMVILENLQQNEEAPLQWTDGTILDPLNGKTYRSTITLSDDGMKLRVRGYIGIPLFGRSQTWVRVLNPRSESISQ
jgi:uncharacterized protein (DUF2147 family)